MSVPVFDPYKQSIMAQRNPVPCGLDYCVSSGREPSQMGWYSYVRDHLSDSDDVLDVGAGMGDGSCCMRLTARNVTEVECDARLWSILPDSAVFVKDVRGLCQLRPVNVVTCMDVIEHVVEDRLFLCALKSLALRTLYITTPNYTRSRAANVHHAREMTIPQFLHHYCPDQLFVASPDGMHHLTQLVQRDTPLTFKVLVGKHAGVSFSYKDTAIDRLSFCDTTVDGMEWPHIMGVWQSMDV